MRQPFAMKLFDDKIHTFADYQYDGKSGGEQWRRKVRAYLMAKCPTIGAMLSWAESKGFDSIPFEEIQHQEQRFSGVQEYGFSVYFVNCALWGFLGQATTGEALDAHELVDELNGLEAWRAISRIIDQGQPQREELLRQQLKHLPSIRGLEGIAAGATKYEKLVRKYTLAGSDKPREATMKSELLDMLPSGMREHVL